MRAEYATAVQTRSKKATLSLGNAIGVICVMSEATRLKNGRERALWTGLLFLPRKMANQISVQR